MNLTKNNKEIIISASLKTLTAKIVEAVAESIKRNAGKNVLGGSFRDFLTKRAKIRKIKSTDTAKISDIANAPGAEKNGNLTICPGINEARVAIKKSLIIFIKCEPRWI